MGGPWCLFPVPSDSVISDGGGRCNVNDVRQVIDCKSSRFSSLSVSIIINRYAYRLIDTAVVLKTCSSLRPSKVPSDLPQLLSIG